MNIIVLSGSPHQNGASSALVREFIRGAQDAGHTVERFNAAFANVGGCKACNYCKTAGSCIQQDDMTMLYPKLEAAELVVFATPLYYFTFSAQLKAVIDRFYADPALKNGKKAMLFVTAAGSATKAIEATYETMCGFLKWSDAGRLIAGNCPDAAALGSHPQQAYEMGAAL
ncbi:MAG: flavodoxin family protein [Oscillospiraceae bacterium]|nr:flavodoxin family protein [Oscillospiraceae bacterium]